MAGFWTFQNDTAQVLANAKGKTLAGLELSESDWSTKKQPWRRDHRLILRFADGTGLFIYDDQYGGRYMTTDDDLLAFVGATFLGAEVHEGPSEEIGDCGCGCSDVVHDVAFLVVSTSLGEFTVETHNEHNGYYGGFMLMACDLETLVVRA